MFRKKFRYYKRKAPPPDFINVLSFKIYSDLFIKLKGYPVADEDYDELGVTNPSEWTIYELSSHSGLIVLCNPFTAAGQRYWITKCLSVYSRKPNILNLNVHKLNDIEDWWKSCNRNDEESRVLKKSLRWVTLGYHHNWDTKTYSESSKSEFPSELAKLCNLIAKVVFGIDDYTAQAAIINFYHMDSTLSGHTDYSEPNKEAPLISFSFGQTAIFLLGGTTLEEDPVAMFLHSGDVVIMAGDSRLRYHGVPRIIKESIQPWNEGISSAYRNKSPHELTTRPRRDNWGNNGNCFSDYLTDDAHNDGFSSSDDDVDEEVDVIRKEDSDNKTIRNSYHRQTWKPFEEYIKSSRINVNVRQVLYADQESLAE